MLQANNVSAHTYFLIGFLKNRPEITLRWPLTEARHYTHGLGVVNTDCHKFLIILHLKKLSYLTDSYTCVLALPDLQNNGLSGIDQFALIQDLFTVDFDSALGNHSQSLRGTATQLTGL